MRRVLLLVFIIGFVASVAAPNVGAYTIQQIADDGVDYSYENSGTYLGTVISENDSIDVVEQVLEQLGFSVNLTGYAKYDVEENETFGDIYVTIADEGKSGTWRTYPVLGDAPDDAILVSYYVVKGSNDFALYDQYPDSAYGTWNMERVRTNSDNTPSISHFSGYLTEQLPPLETIPEPGTLILVGSGLACLGFFGMKRHGRSQ